MLTLIQKLIQEQIHHPSASRKYLVELNGSQLFPISMIINGVGVGGKHLQVTQSYANSLGSLLLLFIS